MIKNNVKSKIQHILTVPSIVFSISVISVAIDTIFFNKSKVINPVLAFASSNSTSLSVVISGLLLFAYLLQYQSQWMQRKIMDRQTSLMKAGYTPILGVVNRKLGYEDFGNDEVDIAPVDANQYIISLKNNGNSTAKNLRLWFGISVDGAEHLSYEYHPASVPLRRDSEGSWWPHNKGGALSNSTSDSVEFLAEPKLKKVEHSGDLFSRNSKTEVISIHKVLEDLDEEGVEEFRLAVVLKFQTTTGVKDEIPLAALKGNPSKIGDSYYLYKAKDAGESKISEFAEEAWGS